MSSPPRSSSGQFRCVLAGRDVLGCAQTGTGKTCAFSVPIIQRLCSEQGKPGVIRALILTPTRELALQIYENVCQYARYTTCTAAVIYGGVSQVPQVEAIERGADILIATPGPPVGPDGAGHRQAEQGGMLCAGRGRPDAGYGLFPGCQAHRQVPARQAADPAVLRDHPDGNRRTCGQHAARPRAYRGHPFGQAGG